MDGRVYWIWMQKIFGAGSSKPARILEQFSTPMAFFEAGEQQWRGLGIFTSRELKAMLTFSLEEAEEILKKSEQSCRVVTPDQDEYPQCLRDIHSPPCALYVKGKIPDVDHIPAIAVVGTRDATLSGKRVAFQLSSQLAKAGAVVVSGGALGIDAAAHKGALQSGGCTVCVLGCGLEFPYLKENEGIRDAAALNGAVITEYPLDTPGSKTTFPVRNRIISGLSAGVLVVEAAAKSGSLITADLALEQGRDVFATPCSIDNPVSWGVNGLLKSGAKPVTCAADILEEYSQRFSKRIMLTQEPPVRTPKKELLSTEARTVYGALTTEPTQFSSLEQRTGLSIPQLMAALTELELAEIIQSYSGRRYSLPL